MTSALLIVDMQMGQFSSPLFEVDAVVSRINILRQRAHRQQVAVVHVQHAGAEGSDFAPGSAGWRFIPGMEPAMGELLVEKHYGSAFHDTALHDRLRGLGVDTVVVSGMKTQYCIDGACRGARALGYRVILVQDAHTTADSPVLSAAQIIAHHNDTLEGSYAELVTADDLVF